jgi:hypothetical protein
VRGRTGRWARWAAAGAAVLGAWLPAAAAGDAVVTSDGTLLSVWVVRGRARMTEPGGASGTSIGYSASSSAGTVVGTVPPTADAASDLSPRLALDPSSGGAVLVWSRFEGVYSKIAYARFEAGAWVDLHELTFGPGDDLDPRLAVSEQESYLFWFSGRRYLYAPVDLALGHLLAVPRTLRIDGPRPSGPASAHGGSDAPIVWGRRGSVWDPCSPIVQGGQDVPVVNGSRDSVWGVGSQGNCRRIVLVVPYSSKLLGVYSFDRGATTLITRVGLPDLLRPGYADSVASAYLITGCN